MGNIIEVGININDDYSDDGFIPDGEKQITTAKFCRLKKGEDISSFFSVEFKKYILEKILKIFEGNCNSAKFNIKHNYIEIIGLSHVKRQILIKKLNKKEHPFIPFKLRFISES